jgi:hypothetical protein
MTMIGSLSFLSPPLQGLIQDGILERKMYESMKPLLLWRNLFEKERHVGRIGEKVIKSRSGLIQPDTEATARRKPGSDPDSVTRSIEQYGYQIGPYGKALDVHLPSSYVAQYNRFLDDSAALAFHCTQTVGRIARDRLIAAYGGGNTFTTDIPGSPTTTVAVFDTTGFDTVMFNGLPVAVSVVNPLPITIGGVPAIVTAVKPANLQNPASGPGTLTLSTPIAYSQFDAVVRSDAAIVVRQGGRGSDHLITTSDGATAKTFRTAAAILRNDNVPAMDGSRDGLYGCFVDPHTESALFSDPEFHDAIKAMGLTGPFADGAIGDYAGIRFVRNTEMTKLSPDGANIQATIHQSLMFGQNPGIEAYIPEAEFEREVPDDGIAGALHYKRALDPDAVLTMVVRAPLDKAGEVVTVSWLGNLDYAIPSDSLNLTGPARFKRCKLIHTAGPA